MNGSPSYTNNIGIGRIISFIVVLIVVFIIYVIRLISLQIVEGADWAAQADDNRTQYINLPAPRGIIYDRNGFVLARNIASYNIVITPVELPDDLGEQQEVFRKLSPLIDLPVSRGELSDATPYVECISEQGIIQIVEYGQTNHPYSPVKVKCDVDPQMAMVVQERAIDMPGVGVEVVPIRDYPTGSLTSAVVGYLGPISERNEAFYTDLGFQANRDKVGYAGVEVAFQDLLGGKNGRRVVERDIGGQVIRDLEAPQLAQPGLNLRLTIDTRLQSAAEAILADEINSWNKYFGEERMTSGVVIAINPQTGEILAMISYPAYENNRMARFIPAYYYNQLASDPRTPLLNHAVG
ncbi:MAG: hypothetical protein EHM70_12350, partial [Chloroflexota bacterium]